MTVGSHSSVSPSAHSVHRNWDAVPRKTQPWGRTSPDHLLVGKKSGADVSAPVGKEQYWFLEQKSGSSTFAHCKQSLLLPSFQVEVLDIS